MSSLRGHEITLGEAQNSSAGKVEHATLAELSAMAAFAADRMQMGELLCEEDVDLIGTILRSIVNIGLVGYLRRHGTESGYQAIAANVARRFTPPLDQKERSDSHKIVKGQAFS
jgi:hypothetical protein